MPRPVLRVVLGTTCALSLALVACGARTGLPNGAGAATDASDDVSDAGVTDASVDADASDAPEDVITDAFHERRPPICVDGGVTYIYLVSQGQALFSFYPPAGAFHRIGSIHCGAPINTSPFSMGVDRSGVAYVVYTHGVLYQIDTLNAACLPTAFVPRQQGFITFGMAFSADSDDAPESLYLTQIDLLQQGTQPSLGLGVVDATTLGFSFVGPYSPPDVYAMELTGTGDGRLVGYALNEVGSGGRVLEIDKQTAAIKKQTPLPIGAPDSALAFAFWGGDFYIFARPTSGGGTEVTRYRPSDGSLVVVATSRETIVGAGVSTCAPL